MLLVRGDVTDPDIAARLRGELAARCSGQLDVAIFNAAPPVRPLHVEPAHVDRITRHVAMSVALVAEPLAALLELLAARSGRVVVVSSSAVTAPKAIWPHHVAAKCAIEGLIRTAAVSAPTVAFLIVRPPPMLTDALNTRSARLTQPISPSRVATAVLDWLAGPAEPGTVAILEHFDGTT
jgi:NAD(P)-dependent dehydrogenase (short-subunit alcohol dehydrogenase family)